MWGIRGQTYNIGMLILGEVRVGVRLPGGWGFGERYGLWGMLIS